MSAPAESTLDTRGLYCPEPVMLLHNRIRDMAPGDVVVVLASDPSTQRDIPRFCEFLGHVFSRAQLLDAVWGYTHDGYEHTVTTHINRLRAKLEADPMRPQLILTVRGAGYKMREAPA